MCYHVVINYWDDLAVQYIYGVYHRKSECLALLSKDLNARRDDYDRFFFLVPRVNTPPRADAPRVPLRPAFGGRPRTGFGDASCANN